MGMKCQDYTYCVRLCEMVILIYLVVEAKELSELQGMEILDDLKRLRDTKSFINYDISISELIASLRSRLPPPPSINLPPSPPRSSFLTSETVSI